MKINVNLKNGFLDDKYSKYAVGKFVYKNNPVCSFPISFENIPNNAKSLALTFVDYDSIPVCGFAWIHWTAANIPADISELPENASADSAFGMVQGANSFLSPFVGETDIKVTHRYAGPTPPDKDHNYTLMVYALDCEMNLKDGFYMNELLKKVNGHILDTASIILPARC